MPSVNLAVSLAALALSLACTVLLFCGYAVRGVRLLLWCALFFVCMTANNVLLFFDLVVMPGTDFQLYRFASSAAGLSFMLYGLIYEAQ
jgi:hypothetical protein